MFNFAKSRVKCSKVGAKVHVIKALICLKEDRPRDPHEIEVLAKSIDYIKALEAEVVRLGSGTVNVSNVTNLHYHGGVDDPKSLTQSLADSVVNANAASKTISRVFSERQL